MRSPLQMLRRRPRDDAREVARSSMPLIQLDKTLERTAIDSRGALMSSDYIACETTKARALRSLPAHVVRKADNGRLPADDHPISKVIHRPNALMSWGDMVAWLVLRRDTFGTAYVRVYRDLLGNVTELRPVTAHVKASYDRATGVAVYSANSDDMNDAWSCREDGVLVVKTDIAEDGGIKGKSVAEKAAADIGLSVDLTEFYRAVMENGNHFAGWLETPNKLGKEDIDAITNSLKQTGGAENAGRIRIFDRGLSYHPVSYQLDGMNVVEQERFVLEKVCRACHVDPHHVYSDHSSTATGAAGADLDFAKNTVLPEVKAIEEAFQPLLDRAASLGGYDGGYRLKLDMNGLLRGDFAQRMEGYRIGVYAGIFTRAYCATCEDIPWLPGQDKLLQPTAYYMVGEDGEPYVPAEPTYGTSGQSDGLSGIEPNRMADALRPAIDDMRSRVRKRADRDGDTAKTRDFARTCAAPIAQCAALMGECIDIDHIIEEAING